MISRSRSCTLKYFFSPSIPHIGKIVAKAGQIPLSRDRGRVGRNAARGALERPGRTGTTRHAPRPTARGRAARLATHGSAALTAAQGATARLASPVALVSPPPPCLPSAAVAASSTIIAAPSVQRQRPLAQRLVLVAPRHAEATASVSAMSACPTLCCGSRPASRSHACCGSLVIERARREHHWERKRGPRTEREQRDRGCERKRNPERE